MIKEYKNRNIGFIQPISEQLMTASYNLQRAANLLKRKNEIINAYKDDKRFNTIVDTIDMTANEITNLVKELKDEKNNG